MTSFTWFMAWVLYLGNCVKKGLRSPATFAQFLYSIIFRRSTGPSIVHQPSPSPTGRRRNKPGITCNKYWYTYKYGRIVREPAAEYIHCETGEYFKLTQVVLWTWDRLAYLIPDSPWGAAILKWLVIAKKLAAYRYARESVWVSSEGYSRGKHGRGCWAGYCPSIHHKLTRSRSRAGWQRALRFYPVTGIVSRQIAVHSVGEPVRLLRAGREATEYGWQRYICQ